jgi:hypothetical protein
LRSKGVALFPEAGEQFVDDVVYFGFVAQALVGVFVQEAFVTVVDGGERSMVTYLPGAG